MKELTPEQLKQKCFDQAVKYLAISPRSEQEVKDKLYEKGYHREQVDYAIERCKGYKYINDESYTRSFVDYYSHKMGRKMLLYKLTNEKGVDNTLSLWYYICVIQRQQVPVKAAFAQLSCRGATKLPFT